MMIRHSPPHDPEKSARLAKWIYNTVYSSVLIGFWGVLPFGFLLPHHSLPEWYFMMAITWLEGIARGAATLACRLAGVSQEGRASESIMRSEGAALAPFLSQAPSFTVGSGPWQRVSVDREGIRKGKKRVLWRDVASCGAISVHNAAGRALPIDIGLQGHDGKMLLHLSASQADATEILPAVRFYLRGEQAEPGIPL